MKEDVIKTDVLCIGGGIAGLMAAIRASELGAKVHVAEKGNAEYSGCGRMGNDHFETYIPEVHGPDRDAWIEELLRTAKGEILISRDLLRVQFVRASESLGHREALGFLGDPDETPGSLGVCRPLVSGTPHDPREV
jgi:succinate dehydrogenase/fumarate reductase flavoprotein subunit